MKKEITDKYCKYLIDSIIDYDTYCHDYEPDNDDSISYMAGEKINPPHPMEIFFSIFTDEYRWNIVKEGEFVALQEYLQGLPNAIELPMWHCEQIALAKKFGSIPQDATEKEEQKIIDNFYKFMARLLIKMKNSKGVWY